MSGREGSGGREGGGGEDEDAWLALDETPGRVWFTDSPRFFEVQNMRECVHSGDGIAKAPVCRRSNCVVHTYEVSTFLSKF